MTAYPDITIRVWNVDTRQTSLLMSTHEAPVTGLLSLHPTGDYILTRRDQSIRIRDFADIFADDFFLLQNESPSKNSCHWAFWEEL